MGSTTQVNGRQPYYSAQLFFFPAAACHAALVLPLSVYTLVSGNILLPGLTQSTAHGHEMLFGFALAVIAGFLINRISRNRLWLLSGVWMFARVSFLLLPESVISLVANSAFAVGLAATAAPQFLSSAKKWRNQIFAPTVIGLSLAATVFHVVGLMNWRHIQSVTLAQALLLLTLLMAFMGGRIIAPAVAGYLQTQGTTLKARVQPRLEASVLLCLLAALLAGIIPGSQWVEWILGILLIIAAALTLVRLWRWRLWLCLDRPDLLCLGIGYGWLVVGMTMLGGSYLMPGWRPTIALHAITIGALGCLTLTVMARTRIIKARQHPGAIPGLTAAVGLISLAAVLRLVGAYEPNWLIASTLLWSLAFILLLGIFIRVPAPAPR